MVSCQNRELGIGSIYRDVKFNPKIPEVLSCDRKPMRQIEETVLKNVRSSKKIISRLVTILAILAVLVLPMRGAVASNSSSHNFAELVWGNGTSWSMVAPPSPEPHPGASQAQETFYEEAPQAPDKGFPISPQSNACDHLGIVPGSNTTPCFHDHTIAVTPGTQGGFGALWHVFLVVCKDNAPSAAVGTSSCTSETVTGIPFGGSTLITLHLASSVMVSGVLTPLTSDAAVDAAKSALIVTIIDTGVTFICPVQPFTS